MRVFLNPCCSDHAGLSRWEEIVGALHARMGHFETERIESTDSMHRQIERALACGEHRFVAAGGDGTVNLLLNALMASSAKMDRITIGAVGLGSSNDFHKPLRPSALVKGIPVRIDFEHALFCDVIRMDFEDNEGRRATRYALTNASIGITAEANVVFNTRGREIKMARRLSVNAAIIVAALRTICTFRPIACQFAVDDGNLTAAQITNLGVVKNPHFAGALCYDTRVEPDDGKLGVNLCEGLGRGEALRMLYALSRRRFSGLPKTRSWMATRVSVAGERAFALEMDGEVVWVRHVRFHAIPKAMRCCR